MPDDYDLAGFAVGVVERAQILSPDKVKAGDQIIGLASNGLHSNGFSLVRKAWTDQMTDHELLERRLADGRRLSEAIITPTRIYVRELLEAIAALPADSIRAAAHITGGGITENLDRALPVGINAWLELDAWPVPEVIDLAVNAAQLDQTEALKTFNMGIGMAVIVASEALESAMQLFSEFTPTFHIGECKTSTSYDLSQQVLYRIGGSL